MVPNKRRVPPWNWSADHEDLCTGCFARELLDILDSKLGHNEEHFDMRSIARRGPMSISVSLTQPRVELRQTSSNNSAQVLHQPRLLCRCH